MTPRSTSAPVLPIAGTLAATSVAVVGVMPTFLVGAASPMVRGELGFGERGLGLAVSVFFASSALASIPGGRLAERIGPSGALRLVAAGSLTVQLGIALLASSLWSLCLLLSLSGVFNGVAQPATNLALVRAASTRQAFQFGVKQSAIPFSTLVAGSSVPLLAVVLGWRWVFVSGAALALVIAVRVPTFGPPPEDAPSPDVHRRVARWAGRSKLLWALAIAAGVGSTAATALPSFLVESSVAAGFDLSTAGWLLAGGSISAIVARLVIGWFLDRLRLGALYIVAAMLIVGAVGFWLISVDSRAALGIGTLLAYSCGWGWTGLMMVAVVRLNPLAPAAATGVLSAGAAGGASTGPLIFGAVASSLSYGAAWRLAAVAALVSGLAIGVVRRVAGQRRA